MEFIYLSESVNIRKISEDNTDGIFEVEGLYGGYGLTVGNALRRVLLSSLPGAVITQIKVKGINHEFSTLPNIVEDIVEIGLNLKKVRFKIHTDEAQTLTLKVKGEKEVTAKDIELNAQAEVITPDIHIATLTSKNADLEIELKVEKGLGYVPVEARKLEKLPIGTISLDAFFSPVTRVNFSVENMRVGDRTDYNKLRIEIKTDGRLKPRKLKKRRKKNNYA
ncbi:MAG: DNA-directed RNA polymerase subunit alpha [Parcubacteria group bacterium Athens0714_26]|nr:MAG: DNA-directed RNA polymerase subunit alpha [Parcubacteria group bacterium Athens0714_26]